MIRGGYTDLPLHGGTVPKWLAERMRDLGGAIVETIIDEYGRSEVLSRLSDPYWFQALGCVLGMDWHSSGITTSVMGALKASLNSRLSSLGIYICGGRGRHSKQTPQEIEKLSSRLSLPGEELIKSSKLCAKVDNTAVQDGYQIYLHSFVLTIDGEWAVIQQGMNENNGYARRYHWHSKSIKSFFKNPHNAICGLPKGQILNLVDQRAVPAQEAITQLSKEKPIHIINELRSFSMPAHHDVRGYNVDLKKLGTALALTQDQDTRNFEDLILLKGLGPRTMQSLALVSEVIYGTASRFEDPARFSFAHGGKDGHPFPVPLKVYDETIAFLDKTIEKSKIQISDKRKALKALHEKALVQEKNFIPKKENFDKYVEKERRDSYKYGGKTVFGDAKPPSGQMCLF
ncbi:MAG: DUF763 domain-containing protein [Flavobacteriales bacterium]|nr:DUF763 domain-containing protein [Flavobacteriales bacterium]